MKKITLSFWVVCFALFIASCHGKQIVPAGEGEKNEPVAPVVKKDDIVIKVSTGMVSWAPGYGWVGKSSVVYDYNSSREGYYISVMKGDEYINGSACPKENLKATIERIKYEISVRDSVVAVIPLNH